jgi:hypothetical protein
LVSRLSAATSPGQQDGVEPHGLARRLFGQLGPGLITGASDDDPSGIGTYSQAGAQIGFGIGWTMLLTFPLMVAIQGGKSWTSTLAMAACVAGMVIGLFA